MKYFKFNFKVKFMFKFITSIPTEYKNAIDLISNFSEEKSKESFVGPMKHVQTRFVSEMKQERAQSCFSCFPILHRAVPPLKDGDRLFVKTLEEKNPSYRHLNFCLYPVE